MIKIFLETSLFIRFFTQDDPKKGQESTELFKIVEQGKARPYTSNIVLMEVIFILTKWYRYPKQQVLEDTYRILSIMNISLVEKTDTRKALQYFKIFPIKYGDCLIASQVPKEVTLVSYDREFKRIPAIDLVTPEEIINKI